jgi:hypothetical protein
MSSVALKRPWWQRGGLPLKVGLGFAAAGIILAIVGIARGNVPLNPWSIFLALAISGGSWGVVSWAIATAAVDVERDIAEQEELTEEQGENA